MEPHLSEDDLEADFAALTEALQEGRLGGGAIDRRSAFRLTALLARLEWRPEVAALSRAMPHFCQAFDGTECRAVLARLGYETRQLRGGVEALTPDELPALLIAPDGAFNVIVEQLGHDVLTYDARGALTMVRSHRMHGKVFTIRAAEAEEDVGVRGSMEALIGRFSRPIWLLLATTFAINILALGGSLSVIAIYDMVIPVRGLDTLAWIAGAVVFSLAVEFSLRALKARLIGHIGGRLEYLTATAVFERILSLPLDKTLGLPIGSQLSQIRQFDGMRDMFVGPFVRIGLELPFTFMFIIALVAIAGPLALAPILLMLGFAVLGLIMAPMLRQRAADMSAEAAARDAVFIEAFSQTRAIRAASCEANWLETGREKSLRAAQARRSYAVLNAVLTGFSAAGTPMAGLGIVSVGALMVMEGSLSMGSLVATMILSWRVLSPIQQAFLTVVRTADLAGTITRYKRFISLEGEKPPEHGLPLRGVGDRSIRLTDATYRYARATRPALLAVSATVRSGEMLALLGPSGSGKTTLMRMMLGLIHPQGGSIAIGGVDVKLLDPAALRRTIGVVPQAPSLFHGTLAQNLRLAAPDASDTELAALLERLEVDKQIARLPNGLETRVTDLGKDQFSYGLRRSIAIAQALARKPGILLLDEAANGLDAQQEAAFMNVLAEMRGSVTIVMATPRPSHARLADHAMLLQRGRVTAFGAPEAILGQLRKADRNAA